MHKTLFIHLFVLFNCFSTLLFSQTDTTETMGGVYLTLEDYKTGKLMYDIDCRAEKQKIKLFNFLAKPYFDVYYQGEKFRLQKNEVYGFKDCHERTFRFYDNMEYELVEAGNICLYVQEQMILSEQAGNLSNTYFFSVTPGSALKPLNTASLKNAYSSNKAFHKLLDENIYSRNIAQYDSINKMYKVNQLYLQSLNKK